ncbi:VanZ family protein [Nocardioides sp. InS609-2]|uniref:VanZ family protein n=1 Tax=Nocardioides sp. InS609-2 TaxID=2760705 RepID=UPI0020C11661|nr:VanZ family protein [Nocardioides sp. InS609-2]
MITDLLLEHPWASPTALAVLVVLGPVVGWWLVARPRLAWWLTGVALLPVALLTLVPVDRELYARCTVQWSLPTPGRVELMANVVLLVAPVLLAGVATRRPLLVLAAGSALSAGLEALQAVVPAIGRSCDTNDWWCNTIGAAVGAVLAGFALRLDRAMCRIKSQA